MKDYKSFSINVSKKELVQNHQQKTKLAWAIVLSFTLFLLLCILIGGAASKILNIIFPAGSLVIALFLYQCYPTFYISFTWWIYFLAPFIRRLVDWKSGFTDPSPILLAPPLVAMITLITLYQNLPNLGRKDGLPLILCCAGVVYSFCIGLINGSPVGAVIALTDWLTPLLFSFHLLANWRNYPDYRRIFLKTFLWGTLFTGIYGIYQYVVAPEWDTYWLLQTGLFTSMGNPEPYELRVWSTMNSPLHYATVMIASTMLLFISREPLRFPALGVGILSLLLTTVRTTWGGWLVAFSILTLSLKGSSNMRLVITSLVVGLCIFQLVALPPFSEAIQSRFDSLSTLEDDQSAKDRSAFYRIYINAALSEVSGKGIGSVEPIDSGVISVLLNLGWIGIIPYVCGTVLIFINLLRSFVYQFDPFVTAAVSISFSFLPMLIGSNMVVEICGMLFWGFLGIAMAAHKYYKS